MKNEKGMVLVLAIFMLALLSMIGLSSMMTSTTDINIAGNEKSSKTVYYHAESGLTMGCEILEQMYRFHPSVLPNNTTLGNDNNIELLDGDFVKPLENHDVNGVWHKDNQTEHIEASPDIRVSGDYRIDIDIDKLGARYSPGDGAEFGTGDAGQANRYIYPYNVESLATLPSNSSIKADHIIGYNLRD
jgi:Tfp pilus assembly protein PilX